MIPMDIYAKHGTKVIFHANPGENYFAFANKCLEDGKEYIVDRTVVHGWRTDVYLVEVPDKGFNSVVFEEV